MLAIFLISYIKIDDGYQFHMAFLAELHCTCWKGYS